MESEARVLKTPQPHADANLVVGRLLLRFLFHSRREVRQMGGGIGIGTSAASVERTCGVVGAAASVMSEIGNDGGGGGRKLVGRACLEVNSAPVGSDALTRMGGGVGIEQSGGIVKA